MRTFKWAAISVAVGALAACGGGGGGGGGSASDDAVAVVVEGVAAKGLVSGGLVTAHAVQADGTVNETPLASGTTGANGAYRLTYTSPRTQRQVLRLAAQTGTTHLDEVTGRAQPLPATFVMRAPITPAANVRASITPFSEMAVAAAAKLPGGLSAANTAQAISTTSQLLGFDPVKVDPKSTSDASTPDEQRQAALLTAVSQLANNNGLGCTGTATENTKCVVDKLAGASTATSFDLGTEVKTGLANALSTVLSTPGLAGKVAGPVLANVISNLQCVGDFCKPAAPKAGLTTAEAITAAKNLFVELKSDLVALFGSDTTTGAVETEFDKFQTALNGVNVPAEVLVKDLSGLITAVDFFNDFNAGRTTATRKSVGLGEVDASAPASDVGVIGCTLFKSPNVEATVGSPATSVGCGVSYFVAFNGNVRAAWRHGFTLVPSGTTGNYTYTSAAQTRPVGGSTSSNFSGTNASGTITTTITAGKLTAFSVTGGLPPAFDNGPNAPTPGSHEWSVTGARTLDGTTSTVTLSASSISVKNASAAILGTLAIRSGSLTLSNGEPTAAALDLGWSTAAGAAFNGNFAIGAPVPNGYDSVPSRIVLDGRLSNTASGATTEFVTGRMVVTPSIPAQTTSSMYMAPAPYTLNFEFSGSATAPSRPQLLFSAGASMLSTDSSPQLASLQYRSLVNGTAKMAVSVSAYKVGTVEKIDITESVAGLSMTIDKSSRSANLLQAGAKIGELNRNTDVITFTDGTLVSVDLGL